jgi:hypothetical protein
VHRAVTVIFEPANMRQALSGQTAKNHTPIRTSGRQMMPGGEGALTSAAENVLLSCLSFYDKRELPKRSGKA